MNLTAIEKKKHPALFRLLLILLGLSSGAQCSVTSVKLGDEENVYPVYNHLRVYEDKGSSYNIEKILSVNTEAEFKPYGDAVPNFGLSSSTYWFRMDISNTSANKEWILEVDYRLLESVVVYTRKDDGTFEKKVSGMIPFPERMNKSRNPAFNLRLGSSETIYISCASRLPVQLPVYLYSPEAYYEKESFETSVFAIYYAIVLVMIMINLIYYFVLKEKMFRLYCQAIGLIALGLSTDNGLAFKFLWPEMPMINLYANSISGGVASFFMVEFVRELLLTKEKMPLGDKIFRITQWLALISGFSSLVSASPGIFFSITSAITLVQLPITFVLGFRSAMSKYRPARYYMIGFAGLALGVVTYVLGLYNIIPARIGATGIYLGSAIEMVFFMISVTVRLKIVNGHENIPPAQPAETQKMTQVPVIETGKTASTPVSPLTEREKEVLAHMALGLTDKEIAEKLFISLTTVKAHARNIYSKLNVKNRTEAVAVAGKNSIAVPIRGDK